MELVQNLWGDKYQVLVCTHTNKDNIHNHVILNSVSFVDGSKYHNSNIDIALLKQTNDDICRKYRLSVIETKKANKDIEIANSKITHYNRNNGKMEQIKSDIDEAINHAQKYDDFVNELHQKGYYIMDYKKYFTITSPYFSRNIRLARAFGEDYTFDSNRARIYQTELYYALKGNHSTNEKVYKVKIYDDIKIDQEKLKTSSFYRLYVHYLYLLGKLPPKIHYEERTKEYYREIEQAKKILAEITMIAQHDFHTTQDVQVLQTQLLEKVASLKSKREKLWREYNKITTAFEKTVIKGRIENLTSEISAINQDIQTCKRIIAKAEKGAKEDRLIQNFIFL